MLPKSRIQEDLRGLIDGEVRCDDVFVQLYSSDASIYQIEPLGVVLPRSTEDVVEVVRYAAENNIPLHARGAGSGLTGGCLGPGLVLDFSKHLRRIIRNDGDSVCVQPGVVHERLNHYLRPIGRQFGPDPSTSAVTTMGGVISVDGGGSHFLKYGTPRRHVRSLQVVLSDGEVVKLDSGPDPFGARDGGRRGDLLARLADLLRREEQAIYRHRPHALVNCCGYQLDGVLDGDQLNPCRLLCGSEGTLGLITEATIATQPLPRYRAVGLLFFDSLDKAARAALEIVTHQPSACDILDRRHLTLARETNDRYEPLIPPAAEAMLLVEFTGDAAPEIREQLHGVIDRIRRKKRLAFDSRTAFDEQEIRLFWNLPLKVVPTLYRLKGSARAVPFMEDIVVQPESVPRFLVELQNALKKHQVTASVFGHAGHGQLHVRPFLNLHDPADLARIRPLAEEVFEAVWRLEGTISGEHGDGLSRTGFVQRQYGPLYEVFREVKSLFDPINLLNPGKIVGTGLIAERCLRPAGLPEDAAADGAVEPPASEEAAPAANPALAILDVQLNWSLAETDETARACNGCGVCRAQHRDVRMCPIFRFAPSEDASPRAKANLLRGVLNGRLSREVVASEEFKRVADLCVNCQMCRLECPAEVDIPKLMIEAKAAHVRAKGLKFGDWLLTRLDVLAWFGGAWPTRWLTNWAIHNRFARWFLEKTLGIAQGRKLPRFAGRTFLQRASRRRLTRPARRSDRKVLYFVDSYVNYCDPALGEALVDVLEHHGVSVFVPRRQRQSGMPAIAMGALDHARKLAAHNVELLAEGVRQGYHIVTTEPSAAMCLTREYPMLLDDDDARLVSANTSEACTYLWKLHQSGDLRLDFTPVNAALAYHMPCHLKALGVGSPGANLLRLVPGISVQPTEEGCSGMAGTFGLKRENYRSSLRAGWGVISSLRQTNLQAGATECSACKMQMEQGTTKPTIHPLKLLALSYGLKPEFEGLLTTQGQELVVT